MRTVSAAFNAAIVQSHTRATRVTVLNADLTVSRRFTGDDGYAIDGRVSIDTSRRRTCQLSLANPSGIWTPSAPGDPFYPNAIVRAERGIIVNGAPEYVSLGVFLIDRPVVTVTSAGSTLQVSGQDRMKLALKSRFTKPAAYDEGTPIGDVVSSIAADAGMGTTLYRIDDAGKALAADRFFETGQDRWPAIQTLAADYALEVFVDADGYLAIAPAVTDATVPQSSWTFSGGEQAIMLGITKDLSDDRLYNHVLVTGEASDLAPVAAEARDLNPASPAYNPIDGTGPIGDRLYTVSSALIRDSQQAQEVADATLFDVALIEETITVPSIVHPALEVGDVVTIVESDSHTADDYLIDTMTIPLGTGPMTLTAKKLRSLTA